MKTKMTRGNECLQRNCFLDTTWKFCIQNKQSLYHVLDLCKLTTDQIQGWRRRGGHEVPALAEDILTIDSFQEGLVFFNDVASAEFNSHQWIATVLQVYGQHQRAWQVKKIEGANLGGQCIVRGSEEKWRKVNMAKIQTICEILKKIMKRKNI